MDKSEILEYAKSIRGDNGVDAMWRFLNDQIKLGSISCEEAQSMAEEARHPSRKGTWMSGDLEFDKIVLNGEEVRK